MALLLIFNALFLSNITTAPVVPVNFQEEGEEGITRNLRSALDPKTVELKSAVFIANVEHNTKQRSSIVDPLGGEGEWTWVGKPRSFNSPECYGWDGNHPKKNRIVLSTQNRGEDSIMIYREGI